ncbi:MAG: oxidoreductase [Thermodesulfovibrio sp.]|nr:oxidoreductase [Thermodesulfovibrio sp.]MDW7998294.1 oxidoreductase [Thermodesulfovibrio sp.]
MIKDKVIVVAGGAGLLGSEFVHAILENEGIAIIADKDELRGLTLKERLLKKYESNRLDFFKTDICSNSNIVQLIDFLTQKYGKIDALVNSAYPRNKNYGRKFLEVEYEDFCENVNLHLGGCFLLCQSFIKYFLKQGYGNIINIASVYGVVSPRFEMYEGTNMTMPVEYAVIKAGIIHLTRYMAKYLKGKNIRVNCISPGGIFDKQPEPFLIKYRSYCLNKGMLDRKDINGTLLFLLSDMSSYINGQNIIVDDGFTI